MKKFILSILVFVVSVFVTTGIVLSDATANAETITPTVTDSGNCGTGATWEYYEDTKELKILGSGDVYKYNYGSAPWYKYVSSITTISVSDDITSLSDGVFYECNKLKDISIPFVGASKNAQESDLVFGYIFGRTINSGSNGDELTYHYFTPSNIETVSVTNEEVIPAESFMNCDIIQVNLSSVVTSIGDMAFSGCTKLEKINLSETLTKIGAHSFEGCSSLVEIIMPDSLKEIDESAFENCSKLRKVVFNDNLSSIGEKAFYECAKLENVEFPSSLSIISANSFAKCLSFTQINLTDNITEVRESAFSGCVSVSSINLGAGLKTIGSNAFENIGIKSLFIPENVELINSGAFYKCGSLKEVSLPFIGKSRDAVGPEKTFGYIFGFTSLNTYSENKNVYKGIFDGDDETFIGYVISTGSAKYVQDSESELTYLDLGFTNENGYSEIMSNDFINVKVGPNTGKNNYNRFDSSDLNGLTWQYTCIDYSFDEEKYTMQSYYFYIPFSITKVTLREMTSVPQVAFLNCNNIEEIIFGGQITTIDSYAFHNCISIKNVTLSPELETIGPHTFDNCSSLAQISIPQNVSKIDEYAFYGCENLKNVDFPSALSEISAFAFANCKTFTEINIPNNIVNIVENAFAGCSSVISLSLGNGLETIGENAFESLAITSLVVPENVTRIDVGAFYKCNNISQITLPFIGRSEDAVGPEGTFGYIFGYKSLNAYSDSLTLYKGIFDGETETCVGYVVLTGESGYKEENDSGVNFSDVGFVSYYGYMASQSVSFINYKIGNNTEISNITEENYTTFVSPDETATWQYTCNDYLYDNENNHYTMQSYYYYIPSSIKKVTITGELEVSVSAFLNCKNIEEINLNDGIKFIDDYSFKNCSSLSLFSLKESVISIGNRAFMNCSKIETFTISSGIKTINEYTFAGCKNLKTINFIDNITKIDNHAFYGCTSLNNVTLPQNLSSIDPYVFGECESLTDMDFSGAITSIGSYAFVRCYGLKNVTLNSDITKIGDHAFMDCTNLEEVEIPQSVTIVEPYTFSGCTSLTQITLTDSITEIENYAFAGCSSVTSLIFGKRVSIIREHAFEGLAITSLSVPENILKIESGAFYNCDKISEVKIPFLGESRTAVGPRATFGYIFGFTTLDTYSDSSTMYKGIFDGDSEEYFGHIIETGKTDNKNTLNYQELEINQYGYTDTESTKFLNYKVGLNSEQSNFPASDYSTFVMPEGTVWQYTCVNYPFHIGDDEKVYYTIQSYYYYIPSSITKVEITDIRMVPFSAFLNCDKLTEIDIGNNITSIESYAFKNNSSLSTFTLPANIERINYQAFMNCSSIETIVVPNGISELKPYTFYGCESLKDVTLNDNINVIGEYAFYGCSSLDNINLPKNLSVVDKYVFADCTSLSQIILTNSVRAIKDYAFYNCSSMLKVDFTNSVTEIGEYAFFGNTSLKSILIPSNLNVIKKYTFANCESLVEINISDTITKVEDYAFSGCSAVASLTLGNRLNEIGEYSFEGLAITTLVVPKNVEMIKKGAFYSCDKLVDIELPFIGKYRGADGPTGTFGYIFGYTTINTYSKNEITSCGIFDAGTEDLVGYVRYTGNSSYGYSPAVGSDVKYSDLGFRNKTATNNTENSDFIPYKIGSNIDNDNYMQYAYPEGTTWQYTCLDCCYDIENGYYTMQSYYYYIPSSIKKVTITDEKMVVKAGFINCAVEEIILSKDVTKIEDYAFFKCSNLGNINLPEKLETIGSYAFSKCDSFTEIKITSQSIDTHAFDSSLNLEQIVLLNKLTSIGEYAFYNCVKLNDVTLPSGLEVVEPHTFEMCSSFKNINIPKNIKNIGESAYADCSSAVSLSLGTGLLGIGKNAFKGLAITSLLVPNNVESIDEGAFYLCESLTDVTLPFIGYSRTAEGPNATFGYIFGFDTATSYSDNGNVYKGIFDGDTDNSVGYIRNTVSGGFVPNNAQDSAEKVSYSDLGFNKGVAYLEYGLNTFVNYKVGLNELKNNYSEFLYPENAVWQYSCIDYKFNITVNEETKVYYTLQSYYYYIPSSITSVNITDISSISYSAFLNCKYINSINLVNKITEIKSRAFKNCEKLNNFDLPSNIVEIGEYAFMNCSSIESIEIYSGVNKINKYLFYNCEKLESVYLSVNVTVIGESAFQKCKSLNNVQIPQNVTEINSYAFSECESFTEINIPSRVESIYDYAFALCKNVELLNLGSGLKTIGNYAFEGLVITTLLVPENVVKIGKGAFYNCEKIIEITLPFVGEQRLSSEIQNIGSRGTFGYIFGFETVSAYVEKKAYTYRIFDADDNSCVGYIKFDGKATSGKYTKVTENAETFGFEGGSSYVKDKSEEFINYKVGKNLNGLELYDFVDIEGTKWQYTCNDYQFNYDKNNVYYTIQSYYYYIPSSITKVNITGNSPIPDSAFLNCENIIEINLNNNITKIGSFAFKNCLSLDIFEIPDGLEVISSHSFMNCQAIEKFEIKDSVKIIEDYAFYNCNVMKNVYFSDTIEEIGEYAFFGCSNLANVTLSEKLSKIDSYAFGNCIFFTEITLPDSLIEIGNFAFSGCLYVENINFGNGLQIIGENAFEYLAITQLVVPKNVLTIKKGAFYSCDKLVDITLPFIGESRTSIGPKGTFGYIFGYEALNTFSKNDSEYIGIFDPKTNKRVGYVRCTGTSGTGKGYVSNNNIVKYSDLGFTSALGYSENAVYDFVNYKVGKNKNNTNYNTPSYPADAIWQYTCIDCLYDNAKNYYTMQSYYYYIPSSITRVTVTDAEKISEAGFMNCSWITYIDLNKEISSVGEMAFYNCDFTDNKTDDGFVVSGKILINYTDVKEILENTEDDTEGNETPQQSQSNFVTEITIPDGIKIIAPEAFKDNSILEKVYLADSTVFIGNYAFYGCSKMNVIVPKVSGYLTIGKDAFTNTKLVSYIDKNSYSNGNDTFFFSVIDDVAEIVGCETKSERIMIPTELGGYTVASIGYKGMANCTSLVSVAIQSNILSLGMYAFYNCNNITNITIPGTCTYIGAYAFDGCSALSSIPFSEGWLYIGDYAFRNCVSLEDISVPNSCNYLGSYAFYNCSSVKSIVIGTAIPEIKEYTFYNCSNLSILTIGTSVKSIGDYAFFGCQNLTELKVPTSVISIGNYAFADCSSIKKVSLKQNILTIGNGAFMNNTSLDTINLIESIESIGAYAFYNCSNLKNATIPELITVISDFTFAYCSNLVELTVNANLEKIGDYAFYRTKITQFPFNDGIKEIGNEAFKCTEITSLVLPDSLEKLGTQAFAICEKLTNVSIPDSVNDVGAYVFYKNDNSLSVIVRYKSGKVADNMFRNSGINSVQMADGITEIGSYSFALCHNLETVIFPESLTKIDDFAFFDNMSYTEIRLPKNVETIGEKAFARGYKFTKISIPDSIQVIGEDCFKRYDDQSITPELTIELYYNNGIIAENLLKSQLMKYIVVDDLVYKIGDKAFADCQNLVKISVPDTISNMGENVFENDLSIEMEVRCKDGMIDKNIYQNKLSGVGTINIYGTSIGEYSFEGNSEIIYVTIQNAREIGAHSFENNAGLTELKIYSVDNICDYAFAENRNINSVVMKNVRNIGNYVFKNNTEIINVTLTGVENIGDYAFYSCNSMQNFELSGNLNRIGDHAFEICKSLKNLILPESVTYIGTYAFYDCNSMVTTNVPSGVTKILAYTYYSCSSLNGIVLPENITEIQDYAFYGCIKAENINIPKNVTLIGDYTFFNCVLLTELTIPDSVTSIGKSTFHSCKNIKTLSFGNNVEEIGNSAFYGCNSLKTVYLGRKIVDLYDYLFYACVNLTDLYVYAPLTSISDTAFYGAENLMVHCGYSVDTIDLLLEHDLDFTVHCGNNQEIIDIITSRQFEYTTEDEIIYSYKIVFKNEGVSVSSNLYNSGETVTVPLGQMTKDADETYTYEFIGWSTNKQAQKGDEDVFTDSVPVVEYRNVEYYAIYDPIYIDYKIIFIDYDGSILSSKDYHYGDDVEEPVNYFKPSDDIYRYEFAGWDKEVIKVDGECTYQATYDPIYIDYLVEFKNGDDVLRSKTYHNGDEITLPENNPSKEEDEKYTYEFYGWSTVIEADPDNEEDLDEIYTDSVPLVGNHNIEYYAIYKKIFVEYTVRFENYDNTPILDDTIPTTYHYGDIIKTPTNTPEKPSTKTYYYKFAGWNPEVTTVTNVTKDEVLVFIATFNELYIEYEITFVNDDENKTEIEKQFYHFGDKIIPPAGNPTKEPTDTLVFNFIGWDREFEDVTENTTYKATYRSKPREYLIQFVIDSDNIISDKYEFEEDVIVPSEVIKSPDETYKYEFERWDSEIEKVYSDKVYTAVFKKILIEYTIVFENYDNTPILDDTIPTTYHYGDKIVKPSVTPTRDSDERYEYIFIGWDKEVTTVTKNETFVAQFESRETTEYLVGELRKKLDNIPTIMEKEQLFNEICDCIKLYNSIKDEDKQSASQLYAELLEYIESYDQFVLEENDFHIQTTNIAINSLISGIYIMSILAAGIWFIIKKKFIG